MTDITQAEAAFAVGIINMIGVIACAVIAAKGKKYAKSADDAVNHSKERGTPRIYDLVIENHQRGDEIEKKVDELLGWKRSYKESPWSNGSGVKEWLAEHEKIQRQLLARMTKHEGVCAEARKSICKIHDTTKGKD